ncbi:hypothetical protein [Hyphomonas sp.]|uniref:hypothetical protein n=1 Tax=Hyphomonas sp. TaxID=87 RepID=UPI00391A5433
MAYQALKFAGLLAVVLCLTGCVTRREHVLAPSASGIVIEAYTHQPVEGAEVRYAGLEGAAPVVTGPDGRFTLEGLTEMRTIVAMPVGGVFRDTALVRAAVPGGGQSFSSAEFINGGRPAQALYKVTILVFPEGAEAPPLRALMQDCLDKPQQDHAVRIVDYVSRLDAEEWPDWLDQDTASGLYEYVRLALPSSLFLACENTSEAYDMFRAQSETLWETAHSSARASAP